MDKRIFVFAALAFAAVACGDDDDPTPGLVIKNDGAVNPPIDASAGGLDSSVTPADAGTPDTGTTNPVVKGAPGCYSGTPTTSAQFLNSCAEGYLEFNNAARLPGYTGTLPTIQ